MEEESTEWFQLDPDGSEQEQMSADLQNALEVVDNLHASLQALLSLPQANEETRWRVVELLSHVGSPTEREKEDQ